jgi:hypothetical protein
VPQALRNETWADLLSGVVFGADTPPRYVLLCGLDEWLLLDRYKWPNNRALRFNWADILDRKGRRHPQGLRRAAAQGLPPRRGNSLLESLDENAHKHAFGVSEDLKYALREAIELLGNEAARQLMNRPRRKKGVFQRQYKLDAGELSLECLRLVYRLLFMFYIEARPELGYVPINKSEIYLKGYSLESLRDLEMQPLSTPHAREGSYFDATLRRLFKLVAEGTGLGGPTQHALGRAAPSPVPATPSPWRRSIAACSTTAPAARQGVLPNHIWQTVIRLMSLTRGQGRGAAAAGSATSCCPSTSSGRCMSAAELPGLLRVRRPLRGEARTEKGKAAAADDEDADSDDEGNEDDEAADDSTGRGRRAARRLGRRQARHRLVCARQSPRRIHRRRACDFTESGHRKLRMYPKGSFIYRLAGRDRQKSASYYTPQVLTQCLVKYALKELLAPKRPSSGPTTSSPSPSASPPWAARRS